MAEIPSVQVNWLGVYGRAVFEKMIIMAGKFELWLLCNSCMSISSWF